MVGRSTSCVARLVFLCVAATTCHQVSGQYTSQLSSWFLGSWWNDTYVSSWDYENCEPLPTQVSSLCGPLLPYTEVFYPISAVESEDAALDAFYEFLPFYACHPDALLFLCAHLFPSCPDDNSYVTTTCRGTCEAVVSTETCGTIIQEQGEEIPDCGMYPRSRDEDDKLCEISLGDPCESYHCENGGSCYHEDTHLECDCPRGWTGDYCEISSSLPDTSLCDPNDPNPCLNGGQCFYNFNNEQRCRCVDGWRGHICQITPDPCTVNPCLNGATCTVEDDAMYYCRCKRGYSGDLCETAPMNENPCACNPCFNGASCILGGGGGSFYCACSADFTGTHCEEAMFNRCDPDPCVRGWCEERMDIAAGFACFCDYGFNGTFCGHDYLKPDIYCEAGQSIQLLGGQNSENVYWDDPETWDNSGEEGHEVTVECTPPSGSAFYEGDSTVQCVAVDTSGNVASCSFEITLTKQAVPEIYCPGDITHPAAATLGYATVRYPDPVTEGAADGYNCWPGSGSNFNIGENIVTCQAYSSGVTARCNFNIHVRDFQKPQITCPDNIEKNTVYQADYNQAWWNPPSVSDNSGLYIEPWCEPESGHVFTLGSSFVVCYARDVHGNEESCSFLVTIEDNQPPNIVCPGRQIGSTEWGRDTGEIWFGEPTTWDNSAGYVNVECDPRQGRFPIGSSEVRCMATDEQGNEADCAFGVFIYDDEAPTVTCPIDMSVKRPVGSAGVTVDWSVRASDNSGEAPTVQCAPNEGHVFQYGTTTVVCGARDASNNRATCQFNVEVTDYDVPVLLCPSDIVTPSEQGLDSARVTWLSPTALTTSDQKLSVECTPASGERFTIGEHRVECLSTNTLGLMSGCDFYINVEDQEDPTIQCPSNQVLRSTDGGAVVPVHTDGPSYEDNSGESDLWCEPDLNTAFDIGIWYVTCYVADLSGNDAQCTFKVQILDDEMDYCSGDPCDQNGMCVNLDNDFHCICNEGYFGEQCKTDICEIEGTPCNGNGQCSVEGETFTCDCDEGWYGEYCDQAPCDGDRCNSNGDCVLDGSGFICNCIDGWAGDVCDEETSSGENGNGDGISDGNGTVAQQSSGDSLGIIVGGAAGGLVLIVVLLVVLVIFLLRMRQSKPPKALSAAAPHHPPPVSPNNPSNDGLPLKEKSLSEKNGLYNPAFGSGDSRYAHAMITVSGSVQPSAPSAPQPVPPPVVPPPTRVPPPTSTKPQRGKKIPPRLPSMPPSAIYNGGTSVVYNNRGGGSVATYGAYEEPNMPPPPANGGEDFSNNIYEEIPAEANYMEVVDAQPPYMALSGVDEHVGYMDLRT